MFKAYWHFMNFIIALHLFSNASDREAVDSVRGWFQWWSLLAPIFWTHGDAETPLTGDVATRGCIVRQNLLGYYTIFFLLTGNQYHLRDEITLWCVGNNLPLQSWFMFKYDTIMAHVSTSKEAGLVGLVIPWMLSSSTLRWRFAPPFPSPFPPLPRPDMLLMQRAWF